MTANSEIISVKYHPAPGDPDRTEAFGRLFIAGEAQDIPAHFADKVRGNPTFLTSGERPVKNNASRRDQPDASDADRLARAQAQAQELQEAVDSDDSDKPRRGRPPKAK